MANFLTRMFAALAPSTGSKTLPPLAPIKAPTGGGVALPSYRKTITPTPGSIIQKKVFDVTNVDLVNTYRNGATTVDNVRAFTRFSPEASASVAANNRVGIPNDYTTIARNPDGSFNLPGTQLAMQILRQMNSMADYEDGFSHVGSLRSVCEALGRGMQQEGAMCLELVLDKARLPWSFQPIAPSQVVFEVEDKGLKPAQKIGGELIDLDRPTFFWVSIDPDLYDAYPQSPMEAAIQPILSATTFLTDMRRLCSRHVYPRYEITLVEEKIKEHMPITVQQDPELLAGYLNSKIEEAQSAINDLGVEEALVHYDFFEVNYIGGDTGNTPDTFTTVNEITSGKVATALKTPPSVLGMGSTSQNLASTETLMFMMNADGLIRTKLMEILSKAMTLAVRLFGLDVTVEFRFADIDLRPVSELEAFRSMKQSRLLTQLSFGFITDEEYCLMTTGQLPPPGHKPLMGTLFPVVPALIPADNGNNTSTTGVKQQDNAPPAAAKGKTK